MFTQRRMQSAKRRRRNMKTRIFIFASLLTTILVTIPIGVAFGLVVEGVFALACGLVIGHIAARIE